MNIKEWKDKICSWNKVKKCDLVKHLSPGEIEYYSIKMLVDCDDFENVEVIHNGAGIKTDVGPGDLRFSYSNESFDFTLSIYVKTFLDRIFTINDIKTGNSLFDKKYGILSDNKEKALAIFSDDKVQQIFLTHPFLSFFIGKKQAVLKCLKAKMYSEKELNELLELYCYIIGLVMSVN